MHRLELIVRKTMHILLEYPQILLNKNDHENNEPIEEIMDTSTEKNKKPTIDNIRSGFLHPAKGRYI